MIIALTALAGTLAILLVATVAAFLVSRDRDEQRHAAEREADRKELQLLLNRIQAPETAVAQTLELSPAQSLDPTSDSAYWEFVTEQQGG